VGGQGGGKGFSGVERVFGVTKEVGDVVGGRQGGNGGVKRMFGVVKEAGDVVGGQGQGVCGAEHAFDAT